MQYLNLIQLPSGAEGRVTDLNGGCGLVRKLNSMGIRLGKNIVKVSDTFMGGPVTIRFDNTRIAISRGMAQQIILEVDD